jgi:hypothetical protein
VVGREGGAARSYLLTVPIAAAAARHWQTSTALERGRAVGAVLAGPAALVSLCGYFWWALGDPFVWSKAQHAWGRAFTWPGPYRALADLITSTNHHEGWLIADAVLCAFYLVCLWFAVRAHVPLAWVVAGAAMVLLPLTSGSFISDARSGFLAVPVYWGLGAAARAAWRDFALRVGFALLLVGGVFTSPFRFP